MATLYIAEYAGLAQSGQSGDSVDLVAVPPIAEQTLVVSSTATTSVALQPSTKFIELSCDTTCSVAFGTNPAAQATNMRLAANERRRLGVLNPPAVVGGNPSNSVAPANIFKVSVISNT